MHGGAHAQAAESSFAARDRALLEHYVRPLAAAGVCGDAGGALEKSLEAVIAGSFAILADMVGCTAIGGPCDECTGWGHYCHAAAATAAFASAPLLWFNVWSRVYGRRLLALRL
jgi:hypothetical protein